MSVVSAEEHEVQRLGSVLPGVLSHLQQQQADVGGLTLDMWCAVVGRLMAGHTRLGRLRDGQLTVYVDQSEALFELAARQPEVVSALQRAMGNDRVQRLRLRAGTG